MIEQKEMYYFSIAKSQIKSNATLVDVGAFRGNWTDYVLTQISGFNQPKMVLFEPNPDNYIFLRNKYFKSNNIEIFNCLVSNNDESIDYYQLKHQDPSVMGMSGCVSRNIYKDYLYNILQIKSVKLDTIFKNQTIDYLKIDTEGFELEVMKGCSNLLLNQNIKFIQFEYGGTYKDNDITLNNVINFLSKYKYYIYNLKENRLHILKSYVDDFKYDNFLATPLKY
jgi:FkbM family methyltransferase